MKSFGDLQAKYGLAGGKLTIIHSQNGNLLKRLLLIGPTLGHGK